MTATRSADREEVDGDGAPAAAVRCAVSADGPSIRRLERRLISGALPGSAAASTTPRETTTGDLAPLHLVADVAGSIAGCVSLIPETGGAVHLSRLCVEPRYRMLGVAATLLSTAAAVARAHGHHQLFTTAPAGDQLACRRYERAGWRCGSASPSGPRRLYYRPLRPADEPTDGGAPEPGSAQLDHRDDDEDEPWPWGQTPSTD